MCMSMDCGKKPGRAPGKIHTEPAKYDYASHHSTMQKINV